MNRLAPWYSRSIGQKLLVAFTGLFLCAFLVVHLGGNLLLFKNDQGQAFREYSEFMATNGLIRTLEIGLALGFVAHILIGIRVWLKNRAARGGRYAVSHPADNSTFASRIMHITGSIVLFFLVVHLNTFLVPTRIVDPETDIFALVGSAFSDPLYVGFYLVSLFLLGFHLRQGFQSAFQTLGLRPTWQRLVDLVAIVFWLAIPVGFASMPIYFFWLHLRGT
jgi:succinate dehydrogenase / fumarate reductase cytochrome b subunit